MWKKGEKESEGKPDAGAEGGTPEVTYEQLIAAVQYMAKGFTELKARFDKAEEERAATPPPEPAPTPEPGASADERLTSADKELVEFAINKVREEEVKPLREELVKLRESQEYMSTKSELDRALEEHPELPNYQAELTELKKAHPTLSIQQLLVLAKEGSPDKVEAERKAAEEKAAAEAEPEPVFHGLMSTSAPYADDTKMDGKEAAEAAYDQVMAGTAAEREAFGR